MRPHSIRATAPHHILDVATEKRLLRAVQEVAGSIRTNHPPAAVDGTLGGGAAGLAIFFACLARALGLERYAIEARAYREAAVNAATGSPMEAGLVDGFVGVCAMDAFLDRIGARGDDAWIDHTMIEETLEQHPVGMVRDFGLELSRGLLGWGVYGLERFPAPGARRLLAGVFDILEAGAVVEPEGVAWRYVPPEGCGDWRRRYPDGYVHFGLTHGVAGIVAFLARCVRLGVDDRATDLLPPTVDWLLARRRISATYAFPTLVSSHGDEEGWAHGDLAVASSLSLAAEAMDDEQWRQRAVDIASRVPRTDQAAEGIVSHALCNGAAGMAHMYGGIHRRCGDEASELGARFWVDRCFAQRRAGHGTAGFFAATDPRHGGTVAGNPGLLSGAAGTALAFLGFVSDDVPPWDRLLLYSH